MSDHLLKSLSDQLQVHVTWRPLETPQELSKEFAEAKRTQMTYSFTDLRKACIEKKHLTEAQAQELLVAVHRIEELIYQQALLIREQYPAKGEHAALSDLPARLLDRVALEIESQSLEDLVIRVPPAWLPS